ncbi:MAG: hypothetical protein HRU20_29120, partial [Pseudomonadales bacterium]|nr:hypothetical protein [Pseudomonadales bacterium]
PESSDGRYFLAFGSDSNSSWVIDRVSGKVLTKLAHNNGSSIGEKHEVRWDTTGNYPGRIYYRYNMSFYHINDVVNAAQNIKLIKNFSTLVPKSTKIYNDVEGDSSNDNDHWAFMAVHYDGSNFVVDAFIHYQISTDKTHLLKPADLTGTGLNHYAGNSTLPRPNMVEISPLGTGVVLHYGKVSSNRTADKGTWFDGAHLWPLNFDHKASTPVKISVSQTHSGWSFDSAGREMFISQNNTNDCLDAIYIDGSNAGYDKRICVANHGDFGWSNGFHYGKMPPNKAGWVFINTYSRSNGKNWGTNQLIMMKVANINNKPKIWRIAPNYNKYDGNYRDEAPAAINALGNRIYVSGNWGGALSHREVFMYELPNNWNDAPELQ